MSVTPLRRRALVCGLVAGLLAGCGGGDDARQEVADGLRRGFTSAGPAVLCSETLSAGLAQQIYGGAAQCVAAERAAAGVRRPATSVGVSRVVVTGDRANAYVVIAGGDQSGTRGPVSLVRREGKWRLDALSTTFLRSGLQAGLVGNAQVGAALGACLRGKLDGLDDAVLRRLGLGVMGARPEAVQGMQALVRECMEGRPEAGDVA